jgi:hypothetical protein
MSPTEFHRQTPTAETDETDETDEIEPRATENGTDGLEEAATSPTVEGIIEGMIDSRLGELRDDIEELEERIQTVDDFARISLNERKVKQNEAKLTEFSESLTAFAEKAFDHLNELESRLDTQALLLAAILESLDDVDLSEVRRHRSERLVMDATPHERLASTIDAAGDGRPVVEVEGIGSTYAERLADAGIESTAGLAVADPEEVVEAADVSTSRATEWIERAE